MSDERKQCSKRVFDGRWDYPCSKPAKIERDGKWYCTIHDPAYVSATNTAREARWEKEREADRLRAAWESARNAAVAGLTTEELRQVTPQMIRDAIQANVPEVK